ncbi:MAG: endonuclease/exonuclease/phosphatase family protein [Anaerolineae bacterium]|nr:endonuclease/exonuclease/phosphatase family protein [Anaerolineae bacterium]
MKFRVLTYNIHHWEGIDGRVDVARVADVIRATAADIVALNEVYHPATVPGTDRPALESMAEALKMQVAFGQAAEYPWLDSTQSTGYGNACLSRWTIQAYAVHSLPGEPGREPRSLLEVRIALPNGHPLPLYIVHLDHKSEAARVQQVRAVVQWTSRDRGRPHLIMGDFNATGETPTIQHLLRADYVDCSAQAGLSEEATWPTSAPQVRIDYIFVPTTFASILSGCQRWSVPPADVASDHFPLLATCALPNK